MKFDILTLFPEMFTNILNESIIGRAVKNKIVEFSFTNIRDFSGNKHNRVDDCPFGGGKGMLLMAEPIALCIEDLIAQLGEKPHLIYMSPLGTVLTQEKVRELSQRPNLAILCGRGV